MHTIITNAKGSRSIEVSDQHLATIHKYNLMAGLEGQSGVTEETLESLRLQLRSLLESNNGDSELINLCKEVFFHDNMKAIGLQNLIALAKECAQATTTEEA